MNSKDCDPTYPRPEEFPTEFEEELMYIVNTYVEEGIQMNVDGAYNHSINLLKIAYKQFQEKDGDDLFKLKINV